MNLKQRTIKKVIHTETDKTIISSQVQTCAEADSEPFLRFPSLKPPDNNVIGIAPVINYTWSFLKSVNNTA